MIFFRIDRSRAFQTEEYQHYHSFTGVRDFSGGPKSFPKGSIKDLVSHALKICFRHIDAALSYGWGQVERDWTCFERELDSPRRDFHSDQAVSLLILLI